MCVHGGTGGAGVEWEQEVRADGFWLNTLCINLIEPSFVHFHIMISSQREVAKQMKCIAALWRCVTDQCEL